MKIIANKENLQRAVGFVERVTSKNTTLPILSNLLLKTENGRLKVSATNLEVGIVATIGANVSEDGCIAVPGRILADFIKGTQNDTVTLTTKQNTLLVDAGKFKTTILGFDAAEYPLIPKIDRAHVKKIPAALFRHMLASVTDSVAISESRPELAGAFLSFQGDTAILAATDGFRLVERKSGIQNTHTISAIVPRGTIMELLRILSDVDGDVEVTVADNQIAFSHNDVEVISRLIDGKYPDYHKVIPERALSRTLVRKGDLENAIKVAALFSSSISDIKIACTGDAIQITAKNSSKGEAQAVIEANTKGDPFDISVNHHYFLDGLKVIETDKVILEFTGTGSPFVLRPTDEKKEMVYLIMPLRN